MSRRKIQALDAHTAMNLTVIVGWDNPLQTFFATVEKPSTDDPDEEDEDLILFNIGMRPHQVATPQALADYLKEWATITPDILEKLALDKSSSDQPTNLQNRITSILEKATQRKHA